ncbi:hypothetical protein GQ43DRAFT_501891 [Delitschia confertaspora ATCC 74209]|uniref:Uncharacterized protein n=1 Tax=Delitschia confertaspora ATCC 74209 TaxID=1513339 RepID=A0A9P4MZU2_9PLEO|nr:hypothetical protein GQ43DRAFT_501891 [Delitschia confertaspora ATCC 74209]
MVVLDMVEFGGPITKYCRRIAALADQGKERSNVSRQLQQNDRCVPERAFALHGKGSEVRCEPAACSDLDAFEQQDPEQGGKFPSECLFLRTLRAASAPGCWQNDTAASLGDYLQNLNIQNNTMLRGTKAHQHEFQTSYSQQMLWLCRQISDLSEYLFVSTAIGSGALGVTLTGEDVDGGTTFEVDDAQIIRNHVIGNEASRMQYPQPGHVEWLITEITTLMSSLPPGIFYQIWIFMPERDEGLNLRKSNSAPPGMELLGSILTSTLMVKVLASIQAMILCDEPIGNEPGNEIHIGNPRSHIYNMTFLKLTVRWAMIGWLQTQRSNPFWEDVTGP